MITLASVNVVMAISDIDIEYGSYTKGTAYVQGTYNGGLVYSGSGYMKGTILYDLPSGNCLALAWVFDWVDDSGHHSEGNEGYFANWYLAGQSASIPKDNYPTSYQIMSSGKSGYGVPGSPKHWETDVSAGIPYS